VQETVAVESKPLSTDTKSTAQNDLSNHTLSPDNSASAIKDDFVPVSAENNPALKSQSDRKDTGLEQGTDPVTALDNAIAKFKGRGYEPVASRAIMMGDDSFDLTHDLLRDRPFEEYRRIMRSGAVEEYLQEVNLKRTLVPPELTTDGSAEISIPAFSLRSEVLTAEKGIVRIYDSHNPAEPLLTRELKLSNGRPYSDDPVISEIRRDFFNIADGVLVAQQEHLDSLKSSGKAKEDLLAVWPDQQKMDPLTAEALSAYMESARGSTIRVVPDGAPIDFAIRTEMGDFNLVRRAEIPFTKDALERTGYSSYHVNGQIQNLEIERLIPKDSLDSPIEEPRVTEYTDRYGNRVRQILGGRQPKNPELVNERISVSPHFPFREPDQAAGQRKDFSVDLSPIGGPDLEGIATVTQIEPIEKQGQYHIYTNMDPEQTVRDFSERWSALETGTAKAEELLGFSAGTAVTGIYVARGQNPNAAFYHASPSTIVVQDQILRPLPFQGRNNPLSPEEQHNQINRLAEGVAFHETAHLLDAKTDWKLSGGALREFFKTVESKDKLIFFDEISERKFLPEVPIGGHAGSNERELFASLLNSLNHPEWEQAVTGRYKGGEENILSETSQPLYRDALEALRQNMDNIDIIPDDAPLRESLDRKIEFLNNHLKD